VNFFDPLEMLTTVFWPLKKTVEILQFYCIKYLQ